MKRLLATLSAAAVIGAAVAVSPIGTPAADAASCVVIYRIYFDSPGSDTGSNTSLNAEWIRLKNRCSSGKSLSGWTIRDLAGHTYRFGTFTLRAGYTVTVHTGRGTNTAAHRYWGRSWYIWNNDGDKAILKNAAGTTVDTCTYSGAGDVASC